MTNSVSRRRAAGLAAAIAVMVGITIYCSWRLNAVSSRGWAGFSYVPPIGKTGLQGAVIGLQPGSVFVVYPGAAADRAGLERGDVIERINGIPASDFKAVTDLSLKTTRGDSLHYRINHSGAVHEVTLKLESPFTSPYFVASFVLSVAVALAYLAIGAFVAWRLPLDSRAMTFCAMTLVGAFTLTIAGMIQIDQPSMRGIATSQSSSDLWRYFIAGAGLFFAPLLLHLALIFPKRRPVVERRATVVYRWIYGYPIVFLSYGIVLVSILAELEQRQFTAIKVLFGALIAAAVASLVMLIVSVVRRGLREGVLASPIPSIVLVISAIAGSFLAAAQASARAKSVMPMFFASMVLIVFIIASFGSYAVATVVALYRSYRESGAEERRQVKWPVWGTMVTLGGKIVLSLFGFVAIFGSFGHGPSINLLYSVPEIGARMLYVLIPLSFAFAILKYRLMNIDVIIRRTVMYSILTFVVFALYGIVVVSVGTVLVKFAGLQSQTMLVASTVVIALAAVPIRNRLQQMVDRNLFREKRDYPLALRNIGNAIGDRSVEDFLRYSVEQIQEALQNRLVVIAMVRDQEFVAAAKVGVSDEILGRLRFPIDSDLTTVPEPLRKIGATLIVHVRVHRNALALLAVGEKLSDQAYGPDDIDFLNSAASQIAVGIENVRLRGEEVEFEQARAMQQILLPTRFPQLDRIEITGMWQPARSVGGDYFDTLTLGGGKAAICIGDVAGKGMPAALLMANLQAAVKATAAAVVEPAIVCERVKEIVGGNLTGGKFISFFYGVVDSVARTFVYSNAGHNPPILVRADMSVERLARGGPAMCRLFKDVPQEQGVAPLSAGDRIVLFTDGASEARRGEEDFGDDRLIELILAHRHLGARELQERIAGALRDFAGGDFNDDVTLVVIAVR